MFLRAVGVMLLPAILPDVYAQAPVVTQTNITFRVMAANITDNDQTYEDYALRIFRGLKPDVVAIQEFNYLGNTANEFRAMLNANFGTNFVYFRESGAGYSIPNGIISRWPIIESDSWVDSDPNLNNRGFAWALIDLPGTNDLYVVSVHLKASGGSGSSEATRRAAEAAEIKSRIQSSFPANAFVVVAGDLNIGDSGEPALATFKTFLSDSPIPTDATASNDADTNAGRNERYDYVLPSFTLASNLVPTVIGSRTFNNGLVFDSRVYSPLSDVAPVLTNDSGNAQHMAVVKDFRVSYSVTNFAAVPQPLLVMQTPGLVRWLGVSNLTYTVLASQTLDTWATQGTAFSATTNFLFTNSAPATNRRFFRVVYP
jgi:endonuclease/exonuclease/phosphatase family metal-dependent hydrolase